LPSWVVTSVCEVPRGATPSYAHGYYERDNLFYRAWDQISRHRERFTAWVEQYIRCTWSFAAYLTLQKDAKGREVLP
jgi:glutaconate CoA-transferase, subunit A